LGSLKKEFIDETQQPNFWEESAGERQKPNLKVLKPNSSSSIKLTGKKEVFDVSSAKPEHQTL